MNRNTRKFFKAAFMPVMMITAIFMAHPVFSGDMTAKIKGEAQKMARALMKQDYESMVLYTHPKVVTMVGGKDKMISMMKQGTEQMQGSGVGFESVDIGDPAQFGENGSVMFALVPQTIRMKTPKGTLTQQSSLVAISEDSGTRWYFIDAANLSNETLYQLFPALTGKILLPRRQQPVMSAP